LNSVHICVQIGSDAADGHIHGCGGVRANELGERERENDRPEAGCGPRDSFLHRLYLLTS
jgi:hypothetical protein